MRDEAASCHVRVVLVTPADSAVEGAELANAEALAKRMLSFPTTLGKGYMSEGERLHWRVELRLFTGPCPSRRKR